MPIDLSKREYKVKYLAFRVYYSLLKIYDIKEDRIIKELEINCWIKEI